MKFKNTSFYAFLLFAIISFLTFNSCKKDSISNPYNGKTTAEFNPSVTYGSMTDQDGNTYKTIWIGTQIWMAENLRTTKYRNGDKIPQVTDSASWSNSSTGAYCNFNNTKNTGLIATYGRLYNGYAVNDERELAPSGWHIPSNEEWMILFTYAGGDSIAAVKLKEDGLSHWLNPNIGANNETGFTALPTGLRFIEGSYMLWGGIGNWWSSTKVPYWDDHLFEWVLGNTEIMAIQEMVEYQNGLAVRCVKD